MCLRYADQVTVGDKVLVQGTDQLIQAKVIEISSSVMQGDKHCKNFQFNFF